jgi:O-antigen ligase
MLIGITQNVQTVIGRTKFYLLDRHYAQTVRIGLALICLLTAALATVVFYKRPMLTGVIVAGFVGLAFVLYAYHNLERLCLLLLVVTMAANFGIGTGTGTPITLSLILMVLLSLIWLFRVFIAERTLEGVPRSPANIPIIIFVALVIFSFLWGSYYVEPEQHYLYLDRLNPRLMTGLVMLISPVVTLLFASNIRRLSSLKFFVWWFVGFGVFAGILRVMFTEFPLEPIWNIDGQFSAWVCTLALGQLLFNRGLPNWVRFFCGVAVACWVFVQLVVGVTWLSGWIPVLLGMGILFLLWSRRLLILTIIVSIGLALVYVDDVLEIYEAEREESGETRLEAGRHALEVFERHYLFGTGPAGYHFYLDWGRTVFQLSHNNYVDILAQMGITGLAVYMWLWLALGVMCWKALRSSPPGGFRQGLGMAVFAGWFITMLSGMLGDWVTPFPYTQTLAGVSYTIWHWVFPGVAIALYYSNRALRQESSELAAV